MYITFIYTLASCLARHVRESVEHAACIRVVNAVCVESPSVCISRGKEPPYLTGQSHLIDTRRVPNTLRPPIRYPLLLSASPFSIFFSFSLHLSLSLFFPSVGFSPSPSPHAESRIRIYRARARNVGASAVADFMSSSAQSWKWKYFIRA